VQRIADDLDAVALAPCQQQRAQDGRHDTGGVEQERLTARGCAPCRRRQAGQRLDEPVGPDEVGRGDHAHAGALDRLHRRRQVAGREPREDAHLVEHRQQLRPVGVVTLAVHHHAAPGRAVVELGRDDDAHRGPAAAYRGSERRC
jgi:hypothetical protein